MLFRCQPGFQDLLQEELQFAGYVAGERGEGWVRTTSAQAAVGSVGTTLNLCFAQQGLLDAIEVTGESVNALAGRMVEEFLATARDERFDVAWPCIFAAAAGLEGLGRRMDAVEKAFHENLKKRMGRVARLAVCEVPRGGGLVRGLWVFFVDFKRAFIAREVWLGGQRRMADDAQAPSRSYLKVEEAYQVLGRDPRPGETVVDLGAAPGGWSYSAAKRGAHVIAIDNGPLKGGALDHPLIEHRREDAFAYRPVVAQGAGDAPVDWLFCDLVEEPHHVVRQLITPWLKHRWCRRFVINLKFGRVAPLHLLQEVTAPDSPFMTEARSLRVRHLYHDREEFTLVGEL